jgi:hypothetical protein
MAVWRRRFGLYEFEPPFGEQGTEGKAGRPAGIIVSLSGRRKGDCVGASEELHV